MHFEPMFATDTEYYTEAVFRELSPLILSLVKYEIYARHGYIFENEELQHFFMAQLRYVPDETQGNLDEMVLNRYEEANLALLQQMEDDFLQLYERAAELVMENYYDGSIDRADIAADRIFSGSFSEAGSAERLVLCATFLIRDPAAGQFTAEN